MGGELCVGGSTIAWQATFVLMIEQAQCLKAEYYQ